MKPLIKQFVHGIARFAFAIVLAGFSCSAATISIAGSIRTAGGKPIRGAVTVHDLSGGRTAGQTPFDRQFASRSDGTFTISGVPAGKYQICVEAPQENVLDPCVWSPTDTVVDLSGGKSVAGFAVSVQTGYLLQVHLNDPQALLPAAKGGTSGDAVRIVVKTKSNTFQSFRLFNTAATSRDHYLLVPFDETMTLTVSSANLALSDGNNQRYSADTAQIPVRIPAGGSVPPVMINVAHR